MKRIIVVLLLLIVLTVSCTGNTIYKKPENLIPRDTMLLLLEDLFLASAAKFYENKKGKTDLEYTHVLIDKYNIDSIRFKTSNLYYTSRIGEYEQMIKEIKLNFEKKRQILVDQNRKKDSLALLNDSLKTKDPKNKSLKD